MGEDSFGLFCGQVFAVPGEVDQERDTTPVSPAVPSSLRELMSRLRVAAGRGGRPHP
jgi:hypothetical protein